MDIATILTLNYVGSEWVLDGEDYAGLTWLDDSPKPTKAALEKQWPEVEYQSAYDAVSMARQTAYQLTSDPIFFQAQRGEKTQQEWLDAVQAINDANPYPVKPAK